ncbi:DnaB-like helicase N-terminal domain-containing protein [Escherichia coli]|uniref:DnaB-like helicase N-terminal domain-containing protein n=1 Tax=Escherichia coli TaxID=562 RepID=UPI0002A37EAE|nr:DnaB-like helicase N-terminal domain-containing protein [Escherichia coli]ELC95298.1 replicative DNA helicase [Escherichia coli KTE193]ELI22414.1 replicative DNA helicase [Escherichia coli KTE112]
MAERYIPRSVDAEQAVLGGLMLDNDRWDEVVLMLRGEDFSLAAHRVIFRSMSELAISGQPFDLITLSEHIEKTHNIEALGGFAYLAELSKNTPSAANIMAYVRIVAEKSMLRQLQETGNSLVADVASPDATPRAVLESAERRLFSLSQTGMLHERSEVSLSSAMELALRQLEEGLRAGGMTGTPTGFDELDEMTCGLQPGDLILLAARPSMGKTALGLTLCLNALRERTDATVFLFSIEMSREQLILRTLSMLSRVELTRLRSSMMDDEEWARLTATMGEFMQEGTFAGEGTRKSNASSYLPTIFALSAAGAAGDALSEGQYTSQNNVNGITSTLTGSAGQAALGKALSGGMNETADWVRQRYGQTFDAIYVPPGKALAVHITRQLAIDYEEQGRRVRYDFALPGEANDHGGLD